MASQDWLKNFLVDSGKADEWDSRVEVLRLSSTEDYQGQSLRLHNGISPLPHLNLTVCFWSRREWKKINVRNIFPQCGGVVWCDHGCFRLSFKDSTFHIPSSPGLCTSLSSKRHNLLVSMFRCFVTHDSEQWRFPSCWRLICDVEPGVLLVAEEVQLHGGEEPLALLQNVNKTAMMW